MGCVVSGKMRCVCGVVCNSIAPPPERKGYHPLEEIPKLLFTSPWLADREFEDFFIASEHPDVTITTSIKAIHPTT